MADENTSSDEDIRSILSYDPFAKEGDGEGGEEASAPAVDETEGAEGGGEASEPAEPEGEEPEETEEEGPSKQTLSAEEILAQLDSSIGRLAPKPEPQAPKESELPSYDFNIPEGLSKLLDSEDASERRQGHALLMRGAATAVHQQLTQQFSQAISQGVPRMIQAAIENQQQQQAVHQDFYGKYPELNRPELYPVVQQVGQLVAQEMKAGAWSPKLRDAIGKRVQDLLGTRTEAPAPRPKPGATAVKGRAAPGRDPAPPSDIMDTIFGG